MLFGKAGECCSERPLNTTVITGKKTPDSQRNADAARPLALDEFNPRFH
jgi:hypothetical protein